MSDWEARLDEAIRATPEFRWGSADCCMFAARVVQAITGVDHGARFRYADRWGAGRVLRRYGGIEGVATRFLGAPKDAGHAMRGDVVLVRAPKPMLAICCGHMIAAQGEHGVVWLPRAAALKAWSV